MLVVNLPRVKRYKRHEVEGERARGTREGPRSLSYIHVHVADGSPKPQAPLAELGLSDRARVPDTTRTRLAAGRDASSS